MFILVNRNNYINWIRFAQLREVTRSHFSLRILAWDHNSDLRCEINISTQTVPPIQIINFLLTGQATDVVIAINSVPNVSLKLTILHINILKSCFCSKTNDLPICVDPNPLCKSFPHTHSSTQCTLYRWYHHSLRPYMPSAPTNSLGAYSLENFATIFPKI